MERRASSPYLERDRPILAAIGVFLLASIVVLALRDRAHDWRWYQHDFKRVVADKLGEEKAATVRMGLTQIWAEDLRRADRCVTCHQAVSWKGFEDEEEPFRAHPQAILASHPIERFGCTSCHGGQGYAVDTAEAHGEVKYWEEPLLSRALAESYSVSKDHGALIEMNCNLCHRFDRETKGAQSINLAKTLIQQKGCRACHVINGRGGNIGPDLTFVGDKAPEQYDYGRLSGQESSFAWHVAHFKDPRALVPETVMPSFHLTTKEAQALSMLVMSWRDEIVPAAYLAGAPRTDPQTREEVESDERMKTGPGAWFVKTGCFVCHSIAALGVKSPAQIGPDLSTAVVDVQSRFGTTIEDFLRSPTGTMSVVLTRQIILTPEDRAVAVKKLQEAFEEHKRLNEAK